MRVGVAIEYMPSTLECILIAFPLRAENVNFLNLNEKERVQTGSKRPNVLGIGAMRVHAECIWMFFH